MDGYCRQKLSIRSIGEASKIRPVENKREVKRTLTQSRQSRRAKFRVSRGVVVTIAFIIKRACYNRPSCRGLMHFLRLEVSGTSDTARGK